MKESTFYQGIIEEGMEKGAIREAKKILLQQGQIRFGPIQEPMRSTLEAIGDLDRLERMTGRVLGVANWQELLDTP